MSIGTAKPTATELTEVVHHFINSHSITDEVSAARFAREAGELTEKLFESNDYLVLTGGSGMFVDALTFGIDDLPRNEELRKELSTLVEEKGLDILLTELKEKDPVYFENVDRRNPVRIIRAIEIIRLTGKAYSSLRSKTKKTTNYKIHRFILDHNREELYKRINKRVDDMINAGLLEEVKSLIRYKSLNSLNTVGYKELFVYLEEKITLDKAIDLIKQHTRNYAKRQITWLNKYTDAIHLNYTDVDDLLKKIVSEINKTI